MARLEDVIKKRSGITEKSAIASWLAVAGVGLAGLAFPPFAAIAEAVAPVFGSLFMATSVEAAFWVVDDYRYQVWIKNSKSLARIFPVLLTFHNSVHGQKFPSKYSSLLQLLQS